MSINRIQKLLFSEYCEFEDMVLVESPFAETTRDGKGLRQVQLGITPSKLVLATDILPLAKDSSITYVPGLDPDIETFELIAVYPIECVNLSVFHRRKRQSLKARFCNNKVLYFELGGFEKRNMFWNLWCEKVKFLNPQNPNSSHSETSVATITTNSTLYLLSSKRFINQTGNSQLWCRYASGDHIQSEQPKWTDKYLYLGKNMDESPLKYVPCQNAPTLEEFIHKKKFCASKNQLQLPELKVTTSGLAQVNRFRSGVKENCSTGLFLPAEDVLINQKFSESTTETVGALSLYKSCMDQSLEFKELAENAVRLWEFYKVTSSTLSTRAKHRRRFAFSPQPHFLHGLGPWNVSNGERFSVQMKRAVSMVCVKRQPVDQELRLSVSRRQLVASISCDVLHANEKLINFNTNTIRNPPKRPVIFFWTPEYWYRPRSARDSYQELQAHLKKIRQYHQLNQSFRILRRRKNAQNEDSESTSSSTDDEISRRQCRRKRKTLITRMQPLTRKFSDITDKDSTNRAQKETSLQFLKRILRMEVALTSWDFDSNTLAYQLTLIDKELFLKITPSELGVLIWQQSSKNAPNVGALIAFSHRICCLVVSEILKDDSEKIRARLVARFINTADKCNKISNFQSCRSVLCGLQSPPVYRLYSMWSYVRKRHSSKYEIFENLCRLYRDPRLSIYQNAFKIATKTPPYLPFVGDILGKLLDRIPEYTNFTTNTLGIKVSVKQKHVINTKEEARKEIPSLLRKILSTLKMTREEENRRTSYDYSQKLSHCGRQRSLSDYYKPLSCFEDNRQACLNECVQLLETYQKAVANYAYTRNELAREYLLKARYREDKENFFHSFNIEPPLRYDN